MMKTFHTVQSLSSAFSIRSDILNCLHCSPFVLDQKFWLPYKQLRPSRIHARHSLKSLKRLLFTSLERFGSKQPEIIIRNNHFKMLYIKQPILSFPLQGGLFGDTWQARKSHFVLAKCFFTYLKSGPVARANHFSSKVNLNLCRDTYY